MSLQLTALTATWDLEDFDHQDIPEQDTQPPPSVLENTLRAEIDRLQAELSESQAEHQAKDDQIKYQKGRVIDLSQHIIGFIKASSILKEASQQEATSRTGSLIVKWQQTFTDLIVQGVAKGDTGSES